jgi:potassium intermediate/small conductance calcium-activated channel subfamily N protein 2
LITDVKKKEKPPSYSRKLSDIHQDLDLKKKGRKRKHSKTSSATRSAPTDSFTGNTSDFSARENDLYSIETEDDKDIDGVFDIRVSNSLFTRVVIAEFCSLFFANLGLFLSILIYELRWMFVENEQEYEGRAIVFAQFQMMMCTVFLMLSIYIRYDIWLQWAVTVDKYTKYDNFTSTGLWKSLLFEIVMAAIAPMPFFDGMKYTEYVAGFDFTIEYEWNDLLLYFSCTRLYMNFKMILYLTQFMNPRAQRVCLLNNCTADTMFAIKGLFKQKPYQILYGSLVISTVLFGFQLRLFERQISEASGQDFGDMYNCMWNVIITLTSVGYGELYPKTFWGRIVGVSIAFWGVFITSFFVVTVTNMLNFTGPEEKSYQLLLRLYYKLELKRKAVGVLQCAYIHRNAKADHPDNEAYILSKFRNFRSEMLSFQQTVKIVQSLNVGDSHFDIMQNILESMIEHISDIRSDQVTTMTNINQVLEYMKQI